MTNPAIRYVVGPTYWACYLLNGDASGLPEREIAAIASWLETEGLVLSGFVGTNGEPPRFSWRFAEFGCGAEGGEVVTYAYLPTGKEPPE